MKEKEFNLSEKITGYDEIEVQYIKEFIKIIPEDLKEEGRAGVEDFDEDTLAFSLNDIKEVINKRAGGKLI